MRDRGSEAARRLEVLGAGPATGTDPLRPAEPVGDDEPPVSVPRRQVRPAAAVAAAVLAFVVAAAVWVRGSGSGEAVELPPPQASTPSAAGAASAGSARGGQLTAPAGSTLAPSAGAGMTSAEVVVDVEGRVRRPGLQRLPPGSRVADAVRAAGGTTAGALIASLNLARVLSDGEQLLVPGPGDPTTAAGASGSAAGGGASAGGAGGSAATGVPVDLNAATQQGLDALPGIGPVLADRIVAWRTQHGRFSSVDELAEVPGIGPKALERLRPLVRV